MRKQCIFSACAIATDVAYHKAQNRASSYNWKLRGDVFLKRSSQSGFATAEAKAFPPICDRHLDGIFSQQNAGTEMPLTMWGTSTKLVAASTRTRRGPSSGTAAPSSDRSEQEAESTVCGRKNRSACQPGEPGE